ncbi:hypothetical protein chiPu_0019802 [Chiloscyllium punctatum]|uniref:Uncharacterized protein n=1 Tax=Chiloscyllium punctatum TaxID=137246 RepID=A0A401RT62_CHIPU|nr:hypothetical protein [Chiloscyllium punctatum]
MGGLKRASQGLEKAREKAKRGGRGVSEPDWETASERARMGGKERASLVVLGDSEVREPSGESLRSKIQKRGCPVIKATVEKERQVEWDDSAEDKNQLRERREREKRDRQEQIEATRREQEKLKHGISVRRGLREQKPPETY